MTVFNAEKYAIFKSGLSFSPWTWFTCDWDKISGRNGSIFTVTWAKLEVHLLCWLAYDSVCFQCILPWNFHVSNHKTPHLVTRESIRANLITSSYLMLEVILCVYDQVSIRANSLISHEPGCFLMCWWRLAVAYVLALPHSDLLGLLRTIQEHSGQLKTIKNNSGLFRSTQGHLGLFRMTKDRSGELRITLSTTQNHSGPLRTNQDYPEPCRTNQDRSRPFKTLQDCLEHLRTSFRTS